MHWEDVFNNFNFLMRGGVVTLLLATLSIAGSLVLGTIFGVIRYIKIPPFSQIAAVYVESVRSIPLILFIVFIHFGFLPYIFGGPTSFFVSSSAFLLSITI